MYVVRWDRYMDGRTICRPALALCVVALGSVAALCQQAPSNIVQPGAPGQPGKALTEVTAAPPAKPPSEADIRFMQDMIMHHGQAVEMTELARTRAKDPEVLDMARKIDVSQGDEIRWMKQWLTDRGIPVETMDSMPGMDHSGMAMDHSGMQMDHGAPTAKSGDHAGMDHAMAGMDHGDMAGMDHSNMAGTDHGTSPDPMDIAMMPGMLTPRQMQALRASTGPQFDHLFLTGMMQHHNGALLMVKQLFNNPGAGQDPQLFDFASDVDNTQLAEINIMNGILRKEHP